VNALNGLCITDAVKQFGMTSKTLRYYERVGLLESKRAEGNNYRYYSELEVERIKQILVLRKMQISIKDIVRIYENDDMSTVVEVFVSRVNAIDEEIGALSELKRVTNDFLHVMLKNGITKISALPILYEQMEKQLDILDKNKTINYAELSSLSDKLAKPFVPSILSLPTMRVLSSVRKDGISDPDGFWHWVQTKAIPQGEPGQHEQFEFQMEADDIFILKVSDDFINDGEYSDYIWGGGLFAAVNVYLDEDLGTCFRLLVKAFDSNKYYQIDYQSDGSLRSAAMLENLISSDDQRELVSLLVPVKKRLADPALFDKPIEMTNITVEEIEAANPVLWTIDVPFDTLKPINHPHYRILDNGELEYTGYISTRVLSTDINVKLPFRVDIEFKVGEYTGFGANDGSVRIYHGNHGLDHNYAFTINTANDGVIHFHQPIFRDIYKFPGRGRFWQDKYNTLTWIVGDKYLTCIINGEIRYCGTNFPYMALDKSLQVPLPIIFGSERTKYFKRVCVSQLAQAPKNKLKTGELTMITKQSNNIIPIIHRLVTDEYGENYWFNGCAKYVMECLGEKDFDYWFFAGVTGDVFTQHYTYTKYSGEALSSYMLGTDMNGNPSKFTEEIFAKCGYAATYVSNQDLQKNTEMYVNTVIAYIDKGIPVIVDGTPLVGVIVGYEEYGKVLLFITGNNDKPQRMTIEKLLCGENELPLLDNPFYKYPVKPGGWIFVGEKKENIDLAKLYRNAILEIPKHFSVKTDLYCFGPEAFRAWANDIENGKFDGMKADEFDAWAYYSNYVCVLATNGSCCHGFLKKAQELNPDMGFVEEISALYRRTAQMWGGDNTKNDSDSLEALGGGFNVTLEALQDKNRRGKIAAKIREFADVTEEILQTLALYV